MKRLGWLALSCSIVVSCGGDDGGNGVDGGGSPIGDGSVADGPPIVGACGRVEPARPTPIPLTGQGPATLGTTDTDGNGLFDRDEWGAQTFMPADADLDGTGDYQDRDDDNDGILDIYDAQRVIPAAEPLTAPEALSVERVFGEVGTLTFTDVARPGDVLAIVAPGLGCEAIVILAGPGALVNLAPAGGADGVLRVVVPEGSFTRVAVAVGDRRSSWSPLQIRPKGSPLLADPPAEAFVTGGRATLAGVSLTGATVKLGTAVLTPISATDASIVVPLPIMPVSDKAMAQTPAGTSNTITFRVRRALPLAFQPPAPTLAGPFEAVLGTDVVPVTAGTTQNATASLTSPELVVVEAPDPTTMTPRAVALAYTLPSDASITVDVTSTAVALALQGANLTGRFLPSEWAEARTRVAALPEVAALGAALAAAFATPAAGDGPLTLGRPAVAEALRAAVASTQAMLGKALMDKGFGPLTAPLVRALAATVMPLIEPPSRQNVFVESYGDEGNVQVRNSTALYLTTEIKDNDRGIVMVPMGLGIYDPNLVEPQTGIGFTGVFRDQEVEYRAPFGRSAKVKVITAGSHVPAVQTMDQQRAHMLLMVRTIVDRIVAPLLQETLELAMPEHIAVKLILTHAYPVVVDAYQQFWLKGDVQGALAFYLNFMKREAEGPGPLLKAFLSHYFRSGAEALAEKAIKGAAKKLVPALDALSKVFTGIGIVDTIRDLLITGSLLEFDVVFGMTVTGVNPPRIERRRLEYDVDVSGYSLYPRTVNGQFQIPSIIVNDKNPGGAGRLEITTANDPKLFIASNGKLMRFTLPASYAANAAGPLEVFVKLGDEMARSPVEIQVTSNFLISSLDPAGGAPGDKIRILGKGFAKDPATTKVFFTENAPGALAPKEHSAVFTAVSDTELSATVPALDTGITSWLVTVQRGVVPNDERTNGAPFTHQMMGFIGVWRRIRYPDPSKPCEGGTLETRYGLWPHGVVGSTNSGGPGTCKNAAGTEYGAATGTWTGAGNKLVITMCAGADRSADVTFDPVSRRWLGEVPEVPGVVPKTYYCMLQESTAARGCVTAEACMQVTYNLSTTMTSSLACGFYCTPGVGDCNTRPWEKDITPICYP